eukprot:c6072_g1_i2.p1 GENE.c6072_g1_i2~~c6072_g1_i2.p1  ORF type:complete len:546 (+),score=152.33 c6072_g1_i2:1403-3040(+)
MVTQSVLPEHPDWMVVNACIATKLISCVAVGSREETLAILNGLLELTCVYLHQQPPPPPLSPQQADFQLCIDTIATHLLFAIQNFFPWLADYRWTHPHLVEMVNEVVLSMLLRNNLTDNTYMTATSLLSSFAVCVRPQVLWDSVSSRIEAIAKTSQGRCPEAQARLLLALSQVILCLPTPSNNSNVPRQPTASSQEVWAPRAMMLKTLLEPWVSRYLQLASTIGSTESSMVLDVSTKLFAGIVKAVRFGETSQKRIVTECLQSTLPAVLTLVGTFQHSPVMLEVLLDYMVVVLDALRKHVGVEMIQRVINVFVPLFCGDSLELMLNQKQETVFTLYRTFLQTLTVLLEEPAAEFDLFIPWIHSLVMGQFAVKLDFQRNTELTVDFVSVVRALLIHGWKLFHSSPQTIPNLEQLVKFLFHTLEIRDPDVVKSSASALEDANRRHRLFSSDVFTKEIMFESLSRIFFTLASGLLTSVDELVSCACSIISARPHIVMDEFIPSFLTHISTLTDQQRSSLATSFATYDMDIPTLTTRIHMFVNDLAAYL